VKYYFANKQRVAESSSINGVKYYTKDHLGSSSAITDAKGMVLRTVNAPYGSEVYNLGTADVAYKFTYKEKDNTGLDYFGARFYDPEVGRFITPDPAKVGSNWYAYCNNNPLDYIDPNGKYPLSVTGNNPEKKAAVHTLGYWGCYNANQIQQERQIAAWNYADERGLGRPIDNEADAYRHFTWNVENTHKFGIDKARTIAGNHEKFGVDGFGGSKSSQMDLWNNSLGRSMGERFSSSKCDDIWGLASAMGLPVNSPNDSRLSNWNFNSYAPIPDWASTYLDYAESQGWSADYTTDIYNDNSSSIQDGSYYD
jgi:RHS repeat-associated protein